MRSAVVAGNDKIYLYGGGTIASNGNVTGNASDLWTYTPSTGAWFKVEPGTDPNYVKLLDPYAVTIGDYQYFIGTKMTTTETWIMRVRDLGNNAFEFASIMVPGSPLRAHGWAFAWNGDIITAGAGNEDYMIRITTDMVTVSTESLSKTGVSTDYPAVVPWPGSNQFVVVGGERLSTGVQAADCRMLSITGSSEQSSPIPESIAQQSMAFDNDHFYLFGGTHKDGVYTPRKALWKADFISRSFEVDDDFPGDPTVLSASCVLNGYLYIFGGKVGLNTTTKCWSYRL
jgi:hypothetical protein